MELLFNVLAQGPPKIQKVTKRSKKQLNGNKKGRNGTKRDETEQKVATRMLLYGNIKKGNETDVEIYQFQQIVMKQKQKVMKRKQKGTKRKQKMMKRN